MLSFKSVPNSLLEMRERAVGGGGEGEGGRGREGEREAGGEREGGITYSIEYL